MSTIISKQMQIGTSGTATDNFTIRQPATPDGTVRIANGNSGTTTDLVTVTSAGNMTVVGTTSVAALAVNGNNISAVNSLGFRNRIINGNMVIDQRNNGASVTVNTTVQYPVDRFSPQFSTTTGTAQRSTVAPAGFSNSLLITNGTGASPSSGQYNGFRHEIEGFNTADLSWGTANALTITLSFWVRSSITGTYAGRLANSGDARIYVFTYTISAANTWEYKTITIAGDTSGTWATDNTRGIQIIWDLGSGSNFNGTAGVWGTSNVTRTSGSVNWIATSSATFQITGVQLEAGTVATPFEQIDYGRELLMCQRYFETTLTVAPANSMSVPETGAFAITDGVAVSFFQYRVQKRAVPTVIFYAPLATSPAGKVRNASTGSVESISGTTITPSVVGFGIASGANSQHYQLGVAVSAEL
jgi:hypothetical protein